MSYIPDLILASVELANDLLVNQIISGRRGDHSLSDMQPGRQGGLRNFTRALYGVPRVLGAGNAVHTGEVKC